MLASRTLPRSVRVALPERVRTLPRPRPELAALLVLAAVLYLWGLSRNGWANDYYAAAVRSMASSWHAFLYGSFDAAGIQTVDKPPLALWVQALSVRVFGFHSLSVLVPQALMGVASVALVHDLVRRRFGRAAGFAGGLALALTPMTVAISRHNNPDALLVLCVTAAIWFTVRALEDGRTKWLVLAGVCVGLGFETKMGAALLVLPAIVAAWLWVAPGGRIAAVRQALVAGAAMAAVALAWPVLMWLTPASDRPWISGTSDNSIWSLILDYNGLGRLDGQAGGPQAFGGGGGGSTFGGPTGALRLVEQALGGQAGWLLGFALVAGAAVAVVSRLRRTDARTGWLVAVGGAFLTCAVAFSFAQGIFHPYYVAELAPFTAALVGAGVGLALRGDVRARVIAPLAVAGGVVSELVVLHDQGGLTSWAVPLVAIAGLVAAGALALQLAPKARAAVVAVALGVLLLAPATWAAQTLGHATSGTFPAGGPASQGLDRGGPGGAAGGARFGGPPQGFAPPGQGAGGGFGGGGFGGRDGVSAAVLSYVRANGGGTIAVSSQSGAAAQIISSGAGVAGIGGFSGRESEVSAQWLAQAVRHGRIRWVLASSGMGGPGADGRTGSTTVMAIAEQVGRAVTVNGTTLYDLQGTADAILAAAG
jgi:4-amino-4-deoxy-L-arabinose transferase-like glycosyltransferase